MKHLKLLNLNEDEIRIIFKYLDLNSILRLSETCKILNHYINPIITSKVRLKIPIKSLKNEDFRKLLREYLACTIIGYRSINKSLASSLQNTLQEMKSIFLEGNFEFDRLEPSPIAINFQNLVELKVRNVEIKGSYCPEFHPDLSKLEYLEISFSTNVSSSWFLSCKNLKELTVGAINLPEARYPIEFDINEILQRQTCLEKLTVIGDQTMATRFLEDDISGLVNFKLTELKIFLLNSRYRQTKHHLIKFLETQVNLKFLGLIFTHDFDENFISKLQQIMSKLKNSVAPRDFGFNGLDYLYFYEKNVRVSSPIDGSLFQDLQRMFPVVNELTVCKWSDADYSDKLPYLLNAWNGIRALNYKDSSLDTLLMNLRIVNLVHLEICGATFRFAAWREFVQKPFNHLRKFAIRVLQPWSKRELQTFLTDTANLKYLEELDLDIPDFRKTYLGEVATKLSHLKMIRIKLDSTLANFENVHLYNQLDGIFC